VVVPRVTAVTRPIADTVATNGFDDDHIARVLTSWRVPSDSVALAINWVVRLPPLREGFPVMETEVTVGLGLAGVGLEDPEQATAAMRNANTNTRFSMMAASLRDGDGLYGLTTILQDYTSTAAALRKLCDEGRR
jgi:hypothetical protein